ncbi:GPI-anchored surface protein, putative [Bodo saltans]|uniref:GPI-anchored surface protein, putative n=1 Tax=Bodo saltans TaxID=75058 RepID=A0A0S4JHZ3_BODSA|nr:GPI-anchored surface protein, putative [Bodo saltans]|eukprot:CUG89752.1 GPI-anchored surface protein, putative [Bodo saltans]
MKMMMNAVFSSQRKLKSEFAAGNDRSKRSPLLLDHVACCGLDHVACCGYCTSDGDFAGDSTGKKQQRCESCHHRCYFSTFLICCFFLFSNFLTFVQCVLIARASAAIQN